MKIDSVMKEPMIWYDLQAEQHQGQQAIKYM